MTAGVVVSSFLGGRLVSLTGRYKIFPVVGLAAASLAFLTVMVAASLHAGTGVIEAALIVLGIGFGLVMPNLMVAIQNAVSTQELGAATATSTFFRSLGGTFGVALSGAIITSQLRGLHLANSPDAGARSLLEQGLQEISQLPDIQRNVVIEAYRHAITMTFLVGAVITAVAFTLVLFLPEYPLRSGRHGGTTKKDV